MLATATQLKKYVFSFWNTKACGVEHTKAVKYSKQYFDEIEAYRYRIEPEIFAFAQFTRHYGQTVLEIGTGAGTDFLQWARAGATIYGIDLTQESINHVQKRLALYDFKAKQLDVGDCESLPYPDNTFDLVYSWGVIHHTPDTPQALKEIIRVCRPSGEMKIMVYHRYSLVVLWLWIQKALLKGKPWKSFAWCLANYMESPGTKAYTKSEILALLADQPVVDISIQTVSTVYDRLTLVANPLLRWVAGGVSYLVGHDRVGWFMTVNLKKR